MADTGPLSGIKVVDLSVMISGPLATMMLADQGAEVIKVESPGLGDIMRFLGSNKGGLTGIFLNNNRGKRSLVADLKHPDGQQLIQRLIADADVLVQNFRPGAMARLGLDYETVSRLNPDLIYASISGYGNDGPMSHRRVYDNVIQAASGLASVQTDPETGRPSLYRTLVCDKTTAYTVAQAVTAALYARATGKARGQHVEVSMLDVAVAFLWPDSAMDAVLLDDDTSRAPTIGSNYAVTELADGFVSAGAVTDAEFRGMCAALGHPELADDERFANAMSRTAHATEMVTLMRSYAAETSVTEFLQRAEEHDVPASAIMTLEALAEHPQIDHNQTLIERHHPQAGRLREPRPAARLSATPQQPGAPAPAFGQHSEEIAREMGLDPAALRAAGAIH